jgi:putative spermidine/putrescine transport system ATP-binding protein
MTRVRIEALAKTYGSTRAVDDVSLSIEAGAFVSLLGPSGCGKTTTLKLVAGFEEADRGAILFDDQDVARVPAEKRDIGMVFQNYALFPHMTVAGNVGFGLEVRRVPGPEAGRRIARVLDMVQLAGFGDRYPRQLSGGQQQRVALARALVIEPRILLLDEPLANLDAKLREEMRQFIRDLQRRVGITTIYVTHDQAEAMAMSDRIVVMFGGRIAQVGAPGEIYERPRSVEVARFVGRINLFDGVVAPDGLRIDLPFGAIAGDAARRPGTRLVVGLRPEAIALAQADAGTGPAPGWAGRVVARHYTGNLVDYRVALAGGAEMLVQAMPSQRFAPGDAVALGAPDAAFVAFDGPAGA